MLEMLQAQAAGYQAKVEETEISLQIMKEDYDEEVKSIKAELSIAKRMLKTTNSAISALTGGDDEQSGIPDEQSTES